MAEQFALRQALAYGAAVDGYELEPAALLVQAVNCARKNLFSCPGFTLQEHGHVAYLGGFIRALQHGCHARTRGDKSEPREDLPKFSGIWCLLGQFFTPWAVVVCTSRRG